MLTDDIVYVVGASCPELAAPGLCALCAWGVTRSAEFPLRAKRARWSASATGEA